MKEHERLPDETGGGEVCLQQSLPKDAPTPPGTAQAEREARTGGSRAATFTAKKNLAQTQILKKKK